MGYRDRIEQREGVRSGKACIRNTRITVADIFSYLAGGMTEQQILADFPELTREDMLACYAYAADHKPSSKPEQGLEWYSAKSLFSIQRLNESKAFIEERVILFKAASFSDAMMIAERESRQYAATNSTDHMTIRYLPRYCSVYLAYDQANDEPAWEVYSRFHYGIGKNQAFKWL